MCYYDHLLKVTTQATGSHGDGTKGTIATRRDILISVPQARVLHTPVLSEVIKKVVMVRLV